MVNRRAILRGIEGHGYMQAEIGAAILERGELCETEFDRLFGWGCKFYPTHIDGDSFILGMGGPQQEHLHLTHLMIEAGLIDANTRDGLVYYSMLWE